MAENKVEVVLGAQWGDEGKGKLVDILCERMDIVCRCAGGNNAGHTVVVGDSKYHFHLLPSGIVHENCKALIGNGVVVHVEQLLSEIESNIKSGPGMTGWEERLLISDRAHIVFDMHQTIDGIQEEEKGRGSIGTTKKGIGPSYSAKAARYGFRFCELIGDQAKFAEKLKKVVSNYQKRYPSLEVDVDAEVAKYKELVAKIKPYVVDTISYLHQRLENGPVKVLVEGANATMLDIDFGTYPYVTSSSCSAGGVCTGLGIPPRLVGNVYGVVKAYTTRVGDGAFPTELTNELGDKLQDIGREFGTTTGRKRRCGWLDLMIIKYTNRINGYKSICLTKLDVLDTFEEIKIGVGYIYQGEKMDSFPSDLDVLAQVEVEYITLPGWQTPITGARSYDELPERARQYIEKIEEISGLPVQWVGVGPARDHMIHRS